MNQMGQLAKSPVGEEMTKQFTQSNDGTNQETPPPSPQG